MDWNREEAAGGILRPEDYAEPDCMLCRTPYGITPEAKAVPQRRIIAKMDEYMSRKDYDGAERHLLYWLEEAKLGSDLRGQLCIRNELIGHFRKQGKKEPAYENIAEAVTLLGELGLEKTISAGTTYTNAATTYYAFGDHEASRSFFEKAQNLYEANDHTDPALLGGLYNNMALACTALKEFEQAEGLYNRALAAMEDVPGGSLEQAITCLNLANAQEAQKGMEQAEAEIFKLLNEAEKLLDTASLLAGTEGPINEGYYAFVCESCAPTFSYYGYFMTADELNRRAKEIYERT